MQVLGTQVLYRPFTNEEVLGDKQRPSLVMSEHAFYADLFDGGRFGEILAVGDSVGKNYDGDRVGVIPEVGDVVMFQGGIVIAELSIVENSLLLQSWKPVIEETNGNKYVDFSNGVFRPFPQIAVIMSKDEWEQGKADFIADAQSRNVSSVNLRKEQMSRAINRNKSNLIAG
jgi:hypothetical protein